MTAGTLFGGGGKCNFFSWIPLDPYNKKPACFLKATASNRSTGHTGVVFGGCDRPRPAHVAVPTTRESPQIVLVGDFHGDAPFAYVMQHVPTVAFGCWDTLG